MENILIQGIEYTDDGKNVVVPIEIWEKLMEDIEDKELLKAMEEAEKTPLLTKEEALKYLED